MCSAIQPSRRAMCGSDTQRQALLAEQRVAAVAGTVGPDQVFFREVGDVFLFDRSAGPAAVFLAGFERSADGVQAGNEIAVCHRALRSTFGLTRVMMCMLTTT